MGVRVVLPWIKLIDKWSARARAQARAAGKIINNIFIDNTKKGGETNGPVGVGFRPRVKESRLQGHTHTHTRVAVRRDNDKRILGARP